MAPDSVDVRVFLAPRHKRQLDRLVAAVSDPSSPRYRHYLSTKQYQARFAPNKARVNAVSRFLTSEGMQVQRVGAGNRYLVARGAPNQAEQAFAVELNYYRHDGRTDRAPASDASVPRDIGSAVLGVSGLSTAPHLMHPNSTRGRVGDSPDRAGQQADAAQSTAKQDSAPPPDGFRNARPCSQAFGQIKAKYKGDFKTPLPKFQGKYRPYAVCGYTPPQLRSAYGAAASGLTGRGATVAITDAYAAPTIRDDANTYAARHGSAPFENGRFSQSLPEKPFRNQDQCGPSGWYGEETLDVEAVNAMAPAANVRYYGSRSCTDVDFIDTLARVVDENQASIVSNSWSGLEQNLNAGTVRAYNAVFEQGAAQGIGFFFSSGDNGDELASTGLRQVDFPSSDPFVTAVGGTSLAVGPGGTYQFEAGWGTNKYNLSDSGQKWVPADPKFLYGAGGGTSSVFGRPDYQNGVVPPSTGAGRAVPDIGLDADPNTGMLIGETQTFPSGVAYGEFRLGGTSLASPLMAGMQALATQRAGDRLGFANPAIYQLAGSDALRDVTDAYDGRATVRPDFVNGVDSSDGIVYSVRTFDDDSSLATAKGYDTVTGVGSPNEQYLRTVGNGGSGS